MNTVEKMLVDETITVLEAMQRLDETAAEILFVERGGRFVATLTDGDIRRWILKGGKLEASVDHVSNYSPKYLYECDRKMAVSFMEEHSLYALPILNSDHRIIDVCFLNQKKSVVSKGKLQIPVVIMAGGKGTRLYPYTKILPKPLIPIGDIPIAEHIINYFCEYGCQDFYLILNHKKNMIKAYFNELIRDYHVYYADEEIPLGTGGGLSLLKGKINSTFILTNCDILIKEDFNKIYKFHKEKKHLITMVCSLKNFQIPYGVVDIGKNGEIEKMNEKPQISFFTNTGCYIVEPEVIEQLEDNKSIGFPDIIEKHKSEGKNVGVYPIGESAWLDMGQMDELERMKSVLERDAGFD